MIVLLRCIPILLLIAVSSSKAQCSCDDPNVPNAQTCHTLFRTLESSLLNNGSNVYKLRKLLSLSPELPELVNVTYYLEFNSTDSCNTSDDFGGLAICTCNTLSTAFINQTYLDIRETIARRYGWTSIGVYTLIHPALLNLLQIQLPFAVMRLHVNKFPFLWNGRNQLPSISLHLSIPTDGLMCIPSDSQVDGVMKSLTSLVS